MLLHELLGDFGVGMVALEAYFSEGCAKVTTDSVAARLNWRLSEDTVRRRLEAMVRKGTVEVTRRGRALYYELCPDVAENAARYMVGAAEQHP